MVEGVCRMGEVMLLMVMMREVGKHSGFLCTLAPKMTAAIERPNIRQLEEEYRVCGVFQRLDSVGRPMDCSTDEFQCLCDSWSSISRMSFFRPPKDWLSATETGQSRRRDGMAG